MILIFSLNTIEIKKKRTTSTGCERRDCNLSFYSIFDNFFLEKSVILLLINQNVLNEY